MAINWRLRMSKNCRKFFKEKKIKTFEDLVKAFLPTELGMMPARRLEIELIDGYHFITILREGSLIRFCWDFTKKTINQQPPAWQGDYTRALGYYFY